MIEFFLIFFNSLYEGVQLLFSGIKLIDTSPYLFQSS